MKKARTYDSSAISKIRDVFQEMTKEKTVTKRELIYLLKADIAKLLQRGFTYVQIAEILTSHDIELTSGTLKAYLRKAKSVKAEDSPVSETIDKGISIQRTIKTDRKFEIREDSDAL